MKDSFATVRTNFTQCQRDELETCLKEKGIETNKHYPRPIHLPEYYWDLGFKKSYPVAEEISETELSLPMYYGMTEEETQYVIKSINEFEYVGLRLT